MSLLSNLTDSYSKLGPKLVFHPQKCLRSRLNTNQCHNCLESCPSNALSVAHHKICLDIAQCTGCMSCVAACPQDALVSEYDPGQLLSAFQRGADVVVSCMRQAQNYPEEITLPCVGILSKQVLAAIHLSGCRSVSFTMVSCAGCCNYEISKVFLNNYEEITEELSDIRSTKVVFVKKREQISDLTTDRRSYLKRIRDIAVDVSKQRFLHRQFSSSAEAKKNRHIPFKVHVVRTLLNSLTEDSQKTILSLFGYTVSIDASCNCCPLCKGICPTGAITIVRTEQGKSINVEMLDCSGCGLCVEFCKRNAVTLERYRVGISDVG